MEVIASGDKQWQETPELKTLLFFLHIPRTGGRTYHQCFLKALYPPNQRCPRSYDTLRLDPANPSCRLLSTHDDYSLMTKLPGSATSVVTNVRDPADRLMSAYEFMIEISARTLRTTAPDQQVSRQGLVEARRKATDKRRTETRNVWPWSYLVPMMEDDLWERREVSGASEGRARYGPDRGPFDTPRVTMPLRDFANHPLVKDLIHNGGTLQVAGLTNNSCLPEATFLRHCVFEHRDLGKQVLEVAKARLDLMLYVGLTERHKDSAKLFATVINRPLNRAAHTLQLHPMHKGVVPTRERAEAIARAHLEQSSIDPQPGSRRRLHFLNPWREEGERGRGWEGRGGGKRGRGLVHVWEDAAVRRRKLMSVPPMNPTKKREAIDRLLNKTRTEQGAQATGTSLLTHYLRCVEHQRTKYVARRDQSLRSISPITFSKELRQSVPPALLAEVRRMSWMDMELLEYGRKLFARQQAQYKDKLDALPDEPKAQSGPSVKEIVAQQQAFLAKAKGVLQSTPTLPQVGGTKGSEGGGNGAGNRDRELGTVEEGGGGSGGEKVEGRLGVGVEAGGVGESRVRQEKWGWGKYQWATGVIVGVVTCFGCVIAALRRRGRRRKGI